MNQQLTPLQLLKKYQELSTDSVKTLLQQRIIYMCCMLIDQGNKCEQVDVNSQIISFIEKINAKVVNSKDLDFDQKINLLSKCFDMLGVKNIRSLIYPFQKQLQLRALCLNNLSIVYKQHSQLQDALKAVEAGITIQQLLLEKNYKGVMTSISSTYVNKCVILSSLKNHQLAAQTITHSINILNNYLEKYQTELTKKQLQDLDYTKMFAYFNLAVEYEHLGLSKLAVQHFETAYKQAKELGDWQIRDKVVQALKVLRKK